MPEVFTSCRTPERELARMRGDELMNRIRLQRAECVPRIAGGDPSSTVDLPVAARYLPGREVGSVVHIWICFK